MFSFSNLVQNTPASNQPIVQSFNFTFNPLLLKPAFIQMLPIWQDLLGLKGNSRTNNFPLWLVVLYWKQDG